MRQDGSVESSKRIGWLHSAPALIAISLGLIYAVGALSIYGQLKGEHLNALQATGLVPIDQILSRGVGRMASQFGQAAFTLLVVLALVGVVALPVDETSSRSTGEDESQKRTGFLSWPARLYERPKIVLSFIVLIFALMLIGMPMREALVFIITFGLAGAAFGLAWRLTGERGEHGPRRIGLVYAAAGLTVIVASNVAQSFLRPTPLPHVRLVTIEGQTLEGGLIAEADSSWFLAEANHSVLAVNARRIRQSYVTYPHRPPEQSALDWLLNRPPSAPLGGPREE